jgi:hypothetical protein
MANVDRAPSAARAAEAYAGDASVRLRQARIVIGADRSISMAGLQKVSTQGRSSTSKDQALRGWRRISI